MVFQWTQIIIILIEMFCEVVLVDNEFSHLNILGKKLLNMTLQIILDLEKI